MVPRQRPSDLFRVVENMSTREGVVVTEANNREGTKDSMYRVVNIGVRRTSALADLTSPCGISSLFNMKLGPLTLPVAPTFVLKVRGPEDSQPPMVETERNPQILIGGNRHHIT